MAEGRFAFVCSVEEFILEQENRNAAQKTERDVRLLERLLKTKVEDRKTSYSSSRYKTLVTGDRTQVAGHCFTYTGSILNIHKSSPKPKNFSLGLIRPKISFFGCLGYFSLDLIRPKFNFYEGLGYFLYRLNNDLCPVACAL